MGCEDCKTKQESGGKISEFSHEADMARLERINTKLWIMCIFLSLLLVAGAIGFVLYESQFETVEEVTTQEVSQSTNVGNNQFVGGDYDGVSARQDYEEENIQTQESTGKEN